MIASDFGTGQVFLSMMYFFLFFIWIYLLIVVFSDIFRSQDLSGGMKAVWTIFVIVFPLSTPVAVLGRHARERGNTRSSWLHSVNF